MGKHKLIGFTLVEVSLFLAVTAVLFVGIITATQGSIWQQRYFDAVQGYAEFWRSIYSQVSNPQTVGSGNAEIAIYGKLVVFGESMDLQGQPVNGATDATYGQQIFVYDVVGDAKGMGTGSVTKMLVELKANVVIKEKDDQWIPAGEVVDYVPRWGAEIETTRRRDEDEKFKKDEKLAFKGSILVVRHPRSGTINTLISSKVIEVNDAVAKSRSGGMSDEQMNGLLTSVLSLDSSDDEAFKPREIDFCLNPFGYGVETDNRRDIRIAENARNGSGVQIIDLDSEENRCR